MINYGKSGAPARVFPPPTPRGCQLGGPVAATMGLVTSLRAGGYSPPSDLVVGLLCKAPTPEGQDWLEVVGEGYSRQPLALAHGPVSNAHIQLLNRDPIAFGPYDSSWSPAIQIAAFDARGALHAYGAIAAADIDRGPYNHLEFAPSRLILRYRG